MSIRIVHLGLKESRSQKQTMSSVYKVTEIEGKGLGCIALVDIQKGSLILNENPKMCADIEKVDGSSKWIKSLLKSFNQMSKVDQLEFMALHDKCSNFQDYQNSEDFQNYKKIDLLHLFKQ